MWKGIKIFAVIIIIYIMTLFYRLIPILGGALKKLI